ncbi:hypothetical protein COLO4_29956 [Corchorus olitorius]|uniref:Uncharacterized protein n=1 Tax=Corchorus olitorius TaxID=93759 RepID=A0A1R3HCB4_9ROSI|nr:hypothetical protein COLO4_29956 [Corchorus olitorius]
MSGIDDKGSGIDDKGFGIKGNVHIKSRFDPSIYDYSRPIRLQQSRNKDVNIKAFAKLLKSKGRSQEHQLLALFKKI